MIKTTYFCDCCKQVIPDNADHVQMVPMNETVDAFVGALSGYEKMTEAHFCRTCTDRIISFAFNPVDIEAMKRGIDESNTIIDTLNAELEEAKKAAADPEEVRLLKNKNDEMAKLLSARDSLIRQLRSDIERLQTTGKTEKVEPPVRIVTPEELEAEKPAPVKAKAKGKIRYGGRQAKVDKAQVMRMHRDGMTQAAIAERVGCDPSYISYVIKQMTEAEKELEETAAEVTD